MVGAHARSAGASWSSQRCFQVVDEVGAGDDGLLRRRRRGAGARRPVPAASSSSPMMTATAAPLRSAAFICAFMLRLVVGPVGGEAGRRAARR